MCVVSMFSMLMYSKWHVLLCISKVIQSSLGTVFSVHQIPGEGGVIYLEQHPGQSSMSVSVMKNKCTNKRTNKRQCFYVLILKHQPVYVPQSAWLDPPH